MNIIDIIMMAVSFVGAIAVFVLFASSLYHITHPEE